jgi:hypothetical protein
MCAVAVLGRANAQEKFEPVSWSAAIITVEAARPDVECELAAEPDINSAPMRKIAHLSNAHCVDRENFGKIDISQHKFVS